VSESSRHVRGRSSQFRVRVRMMHQAAGSGGTIKRTPLHSTHKAPGWQKAEVRLMIQYQFYSSTTSIVLVAGGTRPNAAIHLRSKKGRNITRSTRSWGMVESQTRTGQEIGSIAQHHVGHVGHLRGPTSYSVVGSTQPKTTAALTRVLHLGTIRTMSAERRCAL